MFQGHPRGLSVLFMTEMWERFSYYGIRAILILYMTAAVSTGGLGFSVVQSTAIYALFTSLAYLMNLPGGWVADRIIGQRKAVLYGGILIALGNFCLFLPSIAAFYGGLFLIIIGTGLLKPNVSTIVGQIYTQEKDDRRDAGFYIFYMGINVGALIAPLICSTLSELIHWRLGFLAACIGMIMGLIQYRLGYKHFGEVGAFPATKDQPEEIGIAKKQLGIYSAIAVLAALVIMILNLRGTLDLTPDLIADIFQYLFVILILVFFGWMFFIAKWESVEKDRLIVITVFFFCAALFWSAFEQAGSSLNLFADEFTDRRLPDWIVNAFNPVYLLFSDQPVAYGAKFPTGWFQSLNSIFIILLAPLFSKLWTRMGDKEPSSPAKFAWGLFFVGIGFAILMIAASFLNQGQVSPMWLTALYFVHTVAELCLSPVGLSKVTSLAPARVVGLMMGVWFLGTSLGNFIAGRAAGFYESLPLTTLFGVVFVFSSGIGLLMLLFIKPLRARMHGIH